MSLHKILIDDGEAAWDSEQGANVVCTADPDHKVGTKSAKMAISAGLGAALLATQDIVAGATDYSDCRKVRLWIKSSIDTDAGDLQLLLDATADCPTPEETLNILELTAGTWTLVDIALADPASDGAIVSVGLKQTKELGSLDVYIDDCNGCEVYPEYQRRVIMQKQPDGSYKEVSATYPFETHDPSVEDVEADTQIRRVASGSKTIGAGVTKYLHIDSETNGAEILAVIIKGVVGADWTLGVYIPAEDGAATTAAGDKRDSITYINTDTEGGLLSPFAIAYDCYLDFTNDSAGDDDIDEVIVMYRSRGALTLTWEA